MKVSEHIEQLKKLDQDKEIYFDGRYYLYEPSLKETRRCKTPKKGVIHEVSSRGIPCYVIKGKKE